MPVEQTVDRPNARPTPVGVARVREPNDVLHILASVYVALLPFQIQLARFLRIAPADLFVLLALFLAGAQASSGMDFDVPDAGLLN